MTSGLHGVHLSIKRKWFTLDYFTSQKQAYLGFYQPSQISWHSRSWLKYVIYLAAHKYIVVWNIFLNRPHSTCNDICCSNYWYNTHTYIYTYIYIPIYIYIYIYQIHWDWCCVIRCFVALYIFCLIGEITYMFLSLVTRDATYAFWRLHHDFFQRYDLSTCT